MKIVVLLSFVLIAPSYLGAQNLVPNPSFENYRNCPTDFSQLYKAYDWNTPPHHYGTPDYYNRCAIILSQVSVPVNAVGYENPASGNAYAGIILFNSKDVIPKGTVDREYIETKLTHPLVKGSNYSISLKYSLSDSSYFTTSSFGIILKSNIIVGSNDFSVIKDHPIWSSPSNLDITDGWGSLEFNYVATGGERYMAMGNFNDTANTFVTRNLNHKKVASGIFAPLGYYAYIYLDDISVCPSKLPYTLGNDTTLCEGQILRLDPRAHADNYHWQDGSTNSTYEVTKPGTYYVSSVNNGCNTSSSIKVNYVPLPVVDFVKDTIIYDSEFVLNAENPQSQYHWQDGSEMPQYTVTEDGTYYVKVTSNKGCSLSDTSHITLKEISLTVPNIFTPNNDDINDDFIPIKMIGVSSLSLTVYNRWGNEVYHSDELNFSWKGKDQPDGLYYWHIQYRHGNNKEGNAKGWVQLIR